MSDKYLDKPGLAHFWARIKAFFTGLDVRVTALEQNSLLLNATTGAGLYAQLSGMLATQDGWPGVVCFISNDALKLLTGNTTLTANVHGVITRASSTRFRVFGMYGDTGYIMYWAFDITSAGAITPLTVYRLQGTAM